MAPLASDSPPAAFVAVLQCLEPAGDDPAGDGIEVAIAFDLLAPRGFERQHFAEVISYLDTLLSDERVSNSDLKGMLNRLTSSCWSMETGFGANANGARHLLEAMRKVILRELE
jgi:hypothetical protein